MVFIQKIAGGTKKNITDVEIKPAFPLSPMALAAIIIYVKSVDYIGLLLFVKHYIEICR